MLASGMASNEASNFFAPCFGQSHSPLEPPIFSTSSRLSTSARENHSHLAWFEHSLHVSPLCLRRLPMAAAVSGASPTASKSSVATKKYCVKISASGSNATTRPGNAASSSAIVCTRHAWHTETSGRGESRLCARLPRRYSVSGSSAAIQLTSSRKWMHSGAVPFSRAHQLRLLGESLIPGYAASYEMRANFFRALRASEPYGNRLPIAMPRAAPKSERARLSGLPPSAIMNALHCNAAQSFETLSRKRTGGIGMAISVGTAAPDFTLKDQNQKEVKLSDFQGK